MILYNGLYRVAELFFTETPKICLKMAFNGISNDNGECVVIEC